VSGCFQHGHAQGRFYSTSIRGVGVAVKGSRGLRRSPVTGKKICW